ncbi:MAG: hypothetical protein IPG64_20100 [Haliea sp.]|nr:hypothetical protein [Haliea sp.]
MAHHAGGMAERFARGGAMAMGLMGFVYGMSIQFVLPRMGPFSMRLRRRRRAVPSNWPDSRPEAMQEVIRYASRWGRIRSVAIVPLLLLPVFGVIWLADRQARWHATRTCRRTNTEAMTDHASGTTARNTTGNTTGSTSMLTSPWRWIIAIAVALYLYLCCRRRRRCSTSFTTSQKLTH